MLQKNESRIKQNICFWGGKGEKYFFEKKQDNPIQPISFFCNFVPSNHSV